MGRDTPRCRLRCSEVETGAGWPDRGALGSPTGGGCRRLRIRFRPAHPDVGLEVFAGVDVFLEERVSGEDSKQRLHVEVFAPGEELEQAHAVGGAVGPRGGMRGTIDEQARWSSSSRSVRSGVRLQDSCRRESGGIRDGGRRASHQVDALAVRLVRSRWAGKARSARTMPVPGCCDQEFEVIVGRGREVRRS